MLPYEAFVRRDMLQKMYNNLWSPFFAFFLMQWKISYYPVALFMKI